MLVSHQSKPSACGNIFLPPAPGRVRVPDLRLCSSYFGAALILVALGWLFARVGVSHGSQGTLIVSLIYGFGFAFGAELVAGRDGMRVPSGLLYVLAVSMTPIAVSSIQDIMGAKSPSSMMMLVSMLATIVTANIATARSRISFVCVPALIAGFGAVAAIVDMIQGGSFISAVTKSC